MFGEFNFDMLKALVEDMNRYDEAPDETIKILNTKPDAGRLGGTHYNAVLTPGTAGDVDPAEIAKLGVINSRVHCNPMMSSFTIEHDTDDNCYYFEFRPGDIIDANIKDGKFTFRNRDGDHLVLAKEEQKTFDYMSYLL